jgi:hypothetical protein
MGNIQQLLLTVETTHLRLLARLDAMLVAGNALPLALLHALIAIRIIIWLDRVQIQDTSMVHVLPSQELSQESVFMWLAARPYMIMIGCSWMGRLSFRIAITTVTGGAPITATLLVILQITPTDISQISLVPLLKQMNYVLFTQPAAYQYMYLAELLITCSGMLTLVLTYTSKPIWIPGVVI